MESEVGGVLWALHVLTGGSTAAGVAVVTGGTIVAGWIGRLLGIKSEAKRQKDIDEAINKAIDKHAELMQRVDGDDDENYFDGIDNEPI